MTSGNLTFFKNNVDFYSEEYRDYSLKPWEKRVVDLVIGAKVLDVACGGGRITVPLLRRGHDVVGVDFVGEFEPKIRQHETEFRGKFRFVESTMTALPLADGSFDAVVCVNSLVYLKNVKEVCQSLREMSRVLKTHGSLYIATWNILHPMWGTSVVLNYLLRRGGRFGETSPFCTTDSRMRNSRTSMFVPTANTLTRLCQGAGIACYTATGAEFSGRHGPLSPFHPILVVSGMKN